MTPDPGLAHAWGVPRATALFKQDADDFFVDEILPFTPSGAGEHVLVQIEKRNLTTVDAVKILSRSFHLPQRDISYAGLKDKHGVTRQWLSLRVGMKGRVDEKLLDSDKLRIISQQRNHRKIRRGSHKGNFFRIVLRSVSDPGRHIEAAAQRIRSEGVPNYFGPQRFGRGEGNLEQARAYFAGSCRPHGKFLRGMLISAARSHLFNVLLSRRVTEGTWNRYLDGDILSLDGSASIFQPAPDDADIDSRLQELDIHPTGPMWGAGDPPSSGAAVELELALRQAYPELCAGLEHQGLQQARRALRARVSELEINHADTDHLVIEFSLAKGTYATSVLRELVNFGSPNTDNP